MSQDLLAAVGSRIEARLKAKDSRALTATDVGPANISASQAATFTLLDDTKHVPFLTSDAAPVPFSSSGDAIGGEPAFSADQIDLVAKAQAMAISMASAFANASATTNATAGASATATPSATSSPSATPTASYDAGTDTASPLPANTPPVPAYTPPVPAEFGVGATFGRFVGDAPMTVTRIGDGVVFAMYSDSEGVREVAFHPTQLALFTAAP